MNAGRWDFKLEQGITFSKTITYSDSADALVNLTGYTARMKIKESKECSTALVSLTTENGGITLGGASGTIVLSISDSETQALDFETGVYDLKIIDGSSDKTRLLEGDVIFSKGVTD